MNSSYDFLVVGAGIAGLRAAIELSRHGSVLCLTKRELTESNTQYAQGGIAVALAPDDSPELHLRDTLAAGAGLVNEEAARVLVTEGPGRVLELLHWGVRFDCDANGQLAFTREGAHSRNRVLHANGDSTGREIGRALHHHARSLRNIHFGEFGFTRDLLVQDGRVVGVEILRDDGSTQTVTARAVLLATGGAGMVFANTTNPDVATADGAAMAWRAGAELSDMEFLQFHPTALYLTGAPRFLLSEALRGEGALPAQFDGERFMPGYHELAELAPRDVVARAIHRELETSTAAEPVVYLDVTHLDGEKLKARFPTIYQTCLQYGIDFTRNGFRFVRRRTMRWAACAPDQRAQLRCRASTPPVRRLVPEYTEPIGWLAIPCWRDWFLACAPRAPWPRRARQLHFERAPGHCAMCGRGGDGDDRAAPGSTAADGEQCGNCARRRRAYRGCDATAGDSGGAAAAARPPARREPQHCGERAGHCALGAGAHRKPRQAIIAATFRRKTMRASANIRLCTGDAVRFE